VQDVIVLVAIVAAALVVAYLYEVLRPLVIGLLLAYLAFPIYWFIASLDIDPLLRIFLQILVFTAMYGLVLYMVVTYLYKLRVRTRAVKG
jgi:predicted PurR-regulated permease PerM